MGKKGSGSWLTAVKRAFRSPSKEEKKASRQRDEAPEQEEEEKHKREKRRWLFRKPSSSTRTADEKQSARAAVPAVVTAEQRHAIALAVASAATAEAAVATAEVVRLIRPSADSFVKERYAAAAVFIQTAFRGYLARRALRALKGLVKRQALVRGHNVRKQANMTLRCMQALVRVQARDRDQRMRLAHESAAAASAISHGSNKSSFSCDTSLWDSKLVQDLAERRSMSREGSSFADDWDDRPRTVEEIEAMLQLRKEVALKRERELSYAFSHQLWRSDRNAGEAKKDGEAESVGEEREAWKDRWIASRSSFDNRVSSRAARTSTDKRDPIKTLEIDTARPFAYCSAPANNHRKCPPVPQHPRSPLHRAHHHSPVTPSPSKTRPLQVRSASPRCGREERSFYVTMETPSYYQHYQGGAPGQQRRAVAVPNYMAATESAKARVRSQSAPRQRHATPERDRGSAGSAAKKRLSFPAPAPYSQSLRSPSFKSAAGQFAGDYHSNVSSSCNDSVFGGEVSPAMAPVILRRGLR
ncbi:protein IQ-DOMAIN 18-like [Zingiber officinale]|uniref:protein IQ-DOMAIN 18-like n=1 Tax=Zingiber officinale TaxID=94328 RepID=UPI001C4B0770|nr:protein IQ-DOMAIN 18-like [Zingiber officinale]